MDTPHLHERSRRIKRSFSLPLLETVASIMVLGVLRILRWQTRALRRAPHAPQPSRFASVKPFADGERDLVDECSWESFPASDPPAFNAR